MKYLFRILPVFVLLINFNCNANEQQINEENFDIVAFQNHMHEQALHKDAQVEQEANSAANQAIDVHWYLDIFPDDEPSWIQKPAGTGEIHGLLSLRQNYSNLFCEHYNYSNENHNNEVFFTVSNDGLATERAVNQWQIDRYSILSRLRYGIIDSNQPMNYYFDLLHSLIESVKQMNNDRSLYSNDNPDGLRSDEYARRRCVYICRMIINKMLPLVDRTSKQKNLLDFQEDFRYVNFRNINNSNDANNDLDYIYQRLHNYIMN